MEDKGLRQVRIRVEQPWGGVKAEETRKQEKGIITAVFRFRAPESGDMKPAVIHILIPAREIHYRWNPKIHLIKALNLDWFNNLNNVNGFTGAPVECLVSADDKNCAAVGLSDTLHTIGLKCLPVEETAEYDVQVSLFGQGSYGEGDYELSVRIDTRPVPYYESLKEMSAWWETFPGNEPAYVPPAAKEIMYSTWYSYHQKVEEGELLKEAVLARKLGCGSILLDDGWQTEDNNRGYAWCGDWKPAPSKFPDMAGFVQKAHEAGMKVIPWYSVPFIGERSENYSRFRDMVLDPEADREWHVLDPRYPEVRGFLINTYVKALKDWDLDGFKLDFVDEFVVTAQGGRKEDDRRDFALVEDAADRLMKDCMEQLKAIKPEVVLEFRQTYNGPLMRSFGNVFRAVDCPFDDLENHVRVTDLRLLAGNSAVHSDMLMWDMEDSAGSAALQIIRILFSVPQISMRLDKLSGEHFQMLEYYCGLWKEYQDAFINGSFCPQDPAGRYPVVTGISGKALACVYQSRALVEVGHMYEKMLFVNGSGSEDLLLGLPAVREGEFVYRQIIRECTGKAVGDETTSLSGGFRRIPVPKGGTVEFKQVVR